MVPALGGYACSRQWRMEDANFWKSHIITIINGDIVYETPAP